MISILLKLLSSTDIAVDEVVDSLIGDIVMMMMADIGLDEVDCIQGVPIKTLP